MDHSVCNMKAILAVAVLAMAAFAGVMIVGDDADAADEVTYKVTYIYGDNVSTETISPVGGVYTVTLKTFEGAFGATAASKLTAAGYEVTQWKSGSSVYAIGDIGSPNTVTISGDITFEPVLSANKPIIKLVYGDKSEEFVVAADGNAISLEDLKKFAKTIGATIFKADGSALGEGDSAIASKMYLYIEGYEFKGFYKANTLVDIINLKGAANTVTTYSAVFEEVFDVSFVVEGASVMEITSDKVILNSDKDAGLTRSIPGAPAKENYIFMGWYNAAGEKVIGYSSDKNEYTYSIEDFKFTEDAVLYAKFVPVTFTVTFVYGEDRAVFATETVKYGDLAIEPKGLPEGYKGWDWNFGVPIEADTEIPAIEADPVTVYTVTFEIDGKAPVTQRSDSMVIPDTAIEGKVFQGWVVKGESQYVSPMNYAITGDITFVAVYKEADPPAGPGFFQTTEGKCVAVLIAVVIIAFIYAVYSNMFGLKDALTSVKITRVKK